MSDLPPIEPGTTGAAPTGLDYEVIRLIGRGGYGEVWLVRDRAGNFRACKVIYRESFDHDRPYEREFAGIQKFEPVSRDSESQLHVLHLGRRDEAGYFYYILELADDADTGREIDPSRYVPRTLRTELQRRGRLPLNECLHIGLALSAALEHLHRHGLIHRDIKPANIIFVHGIPKLADIGLVTDVDVSISYVGTEGYIPPEGPTSAQADIYGLGKVLYEIGTGKDRLEFPELPTDLEEMADRTARLEFNAIVTRACQRDLRERYQSARELHADLALLQAGGSVRRHRAAQKWRSLAVKAGVVLAVVLAFLATLSYVRWSRARPGSGGPPLRIVRLPLPEPGALARAEQEVNQDCQAKLAGAGPQAEARFAASLLVLSATSSDSAHELATLRAAAALAKECEAYDVAAEACDKMSERFQMESLAAKLELLSADTLPARTSAGAASLAEACVGAGFQALALDDYPHAQALVRLAQTAGASAGQTQAAREAQFLAEEVARCGAAYDRIKGAAQTLREHPADPAANLAVGQYLCFVKNDWEAGLAMMAHGNDAGLKPVLEAELAHKPVRARDEVAAGGLWWDLATNEPAPLKLQYQRRARYWYLKGIARARGTEKVELKQQLAERISAVPTPTAQVRILARVEGSDHIVLASDEIRWASARGSQKARLNWLAFSGLKAGAAEVLANTGATRVLPEDVDFSSAQMTIEHKGRRRGRATLEAAEDHVRVALVGALGGPVDFEVTVTFGSAR